MPQIVIRVNRGKLQPEYMGLDVEDILIEHVRGDAMIKIKQLNPWRVIFSEGEGPHKVEKILLERELYAGETKPAGE